MPPPYVVDASIWIRIGRNHPPDIFISLWQRLDASVAAGDLVSPDEVLHELERGTDDLAEILSTRVGLFLPWTMLRWLPSRRSCKRAQESSMQRPNGGASTRRILTTHTGSPPRLQDLLALLEEKEEGRLRDRTTLEVRVRSAVADVVKKQAECGLTVINDGEQGKVDCRWTRISSGASSARWWRKRA